MKRLEDLKVLVVYERLNLSEILKNQFSVFNIKTTWVPSSFLVQENIPGHQPFQDLENQFDVIFIDDQVVESGKLFSVLEFFNQKSYREILDVNSKEFKSNSWIFTYGVSIGCSQEEPLSGGTKNKNTQVSQLSHYAYGLSGHLEAPFEAIQILNSFRKVLVPSLQRWSLTSTLPILDEFHLHFVSLSDTEKNNIFLLGRGGFVVKRDTLFKARTNSAINSFNVGDGIGFDLQFIKSPNINCTGRAILREVLNESFVFEIIYVDDICREGFCVELDKLNLKFYIPVFSDSQRLKIEKDKKKDVA